MLSLLSPLSTHNSRLKGPLTGAGVRPSPVSLSLSFRTCPQSHGEQKKGRRIFDAPPCRIHWSRITRLRSKPRPSSARARPRRPCVRPGPPGCGPGRSFVFRWERWRPLCARSRAAVPDPSRRSLAWKRRRVAWVGCPSVFLSVLRLRLPK